MKSSLQYQRPERVPKDTPSNPVLSVCFSPDAKRVVVAHKNRLLIYDSASGQLEKQCGSHKDTIYCVAYSRDGKRFASGSAENLVIVWRADTLEGQVKYHHNDSVQCLAFNPMTHQLASGACSDFGFWGAEMRSVPKYRLSSKSLCCGWTNDGQYVAFGMMDGSITIRDRNGIEVAAINRKAPVWTLSWSPSRESSGVMVVGCWDRTLSFYQASGAQVGKDKVLDFLPTHVSHFTGGEYITVCGSNRKVMLYTKDGVELQPICERGDWTWCAAHQPKQNAVVVGSNEGQFSMYHLGFRTEHGLYQDQYAFRDNMTDVVVQHLVSEERLKIKCRELVKKIAIYKNRLAVQLPQRVVVYELYIDFDYKVKCRLLKKINKKIDCSLLVVTFDNLILCLEKRLQLLTFDGDLVREWVMESVIRYIKVIGGPEGREGLLVGLKNGAVIKIFIDNPFPVPLLSISSAIRCLDLSASRRKLAVVDENFTCFVFDLRTKECVFQGQNASSVAWNTEFEDMFCFSGNGMLSIKTANFPLHQQKMHGFVVGFKGSKIFCLHFVSMNTIDVPQTPSMLNYLDIGQYEQAYSIACLGIPLEDWRTLAMAALRELRLDIAHQAFIRIRDVRWLNLVDRLEQLQKIGKLQPDVARAEIAAHEGRFDEAVKLFKNSGYEKRAAALYMDLQMWDDLKELHLDDLQFKEQVMKKQRDIFVLNGEYERAADVSFHMGDKLAALETLAQRKKISKMQELAHHLTKRDIKELQLCASTFRKAKLYENTRDVLLLLEDFESLAQLEVEFGKWDRAKQLASEHPELRSIVYVPLAEYLVTQDAFVEAQQYLIEANRPREAVRLLEQLAFNAVVENRFRDAAFYFHLLSQKSLQLAQEAKAIADSHQASADHAGVSYEDDEEAYAILIESERNLDRYHHFRRRAELYYAYDYVYRFSEDPFTSVNPLHCFAISRYLHATTSESRAELPYGVSRVKILYALGKLASSLGGFRLARSAFEKLYHHNIPQVLQDEVDLCSVKMNAKPFSDSEELVPMCYRCSSPNPMVGKLGDRCQNCRHPLIRSFISFELLPLVEFFPSSDISDDEVNVLLNSASTSRRRKRNSGVGGNGQDKVDQWHESTDSSGANVMRFGSDEPSSPSDEPETDPFELQLLNLRFDSDYEPLIVDRPTISRLRTEDIFIVRASPPRVDISSGDIQVEVVSAMKGRTCQYFRNMVPEVSIAMCNSCFHFFHKEEWEHAVLKNKKCPFCRTEVDTL